ncbi:hypothetical protein RND81_13G095100 [Saponaria officinalis]|uniref:Uncharacterized protein n=1 Tax=Saponaria officinalis TaxID=3572 RepID=A0AAW1H253_SAPOF
MGINYWPLTTISDNPPSPESPSRSPPLSTPTTHPRHNHRASQHHLPTKTVRVRKEKQLSGPKIVVSYHKNQFFTPNFLKSIKSAKKLGGKIGVIQGDAYLFYNLQFYYFRSFFTSFFNLFYIKNWSNFSDNEVLIIMVGKN